MAIAMYVTEYSQPAVFNGYSFPVGVEPANVEQAAVTISSTSAQSATFANNTQLVRIKIDQAVTSPGACILFGTNPTAVVTKHSMSPGQTEYYAIPPSSGLKVAAILGT